MFIKKKYSRNTSISPFIFLMFRYLDFLFALMSLISFVTHSCMFEPVRTVGVFFHFYQHDFNLLARHRINFGARFLFRLHTRGFRHYRCGCPGRFVSCPCYSTYIKFSQIVRAFSPVVLRIWFSICAALLDSLSFSDTPFHSRFS